MVRPRLLTGCLAVSLVGVILAVPVAAQSAEAEDWTKLRIVQLKATQNYAFMLFQPQATIKKIKDDEATLEVQIYEGNSTDGTPLLSPKLEGPYLELDSTKLKRFRVYTVKVVKTDKQMKTNVEYTTTFTSSPGEPSEVIDPEWEMLDSGDSKANLHWTVPAEPEGPINGYEVEHCYRDIIDQSSRDSTTAEKSEPVCVKRETSVNQIELVVLRGKRYTTAIRAFNDIEPEFGKQGNHRLPGKWKTINPTNDQTLSPGGNNAAVAVLIVISVLLSLVIVGYAGYKYYRKNYN